MNKDEDIRTREDIARLIDRFYKKVAVDPTIGSFFTEVVQLSWEEHIPVMVSFWETILFGTASYKGNPMIKHMEINKLSALKPHHFERWLQLWQETIRELFTGAKADEALQRAVSIAQIMQQKIRIQV